MNRAHLNTAVVGEDSLDRRVALSLKLRVLFLSEEGGERGCKNSLDIVDFSVISLWVTNDERLETNTYTRIANTSSVQSHLNDDKI